MSSTRTLAVLLGCAVALAGCKKKNASSGGEPAGSAAPAESASSAPAAADADAGADTGAAATDDSAAPAAGDAAADAPPPAAGDAGPDAPAPTTPTAGGQTFTGNYNCMGGLTLTQNGSGVRGSAITHQGNKEINYDIQCAVSGNTCIGNATKFVSKGPGGPKGAGQQKVVFKLANGGLDYTEGGVAGFCTRK
jgi:hypothetical protein